MHNQSRFFLGSSIALLTALVVTGTHAQNEGSLTATIQMQAGQMLEIGTDTIAMQPEFSWILTKDHVFQSAQRSRFFQTRPAQTGTYALDVSIQNAAGAQNEYKAFSIVVTEPSLPEEKTPGSGNTLKAVLKTVPASVTGIIYVPPSGGIVTIDGSTSVGNINAYSLDIDSLVDTDRDGNPTNDRDNQDTYSEQSGSPLIVYMTPKTGNRLITLSVRSAATGQIDRATLEVRFSEPPTIQSSQQTTDPSSPIVIEGSDNNARFSATLPDSQTAGKELLYEWDFGDHSRSLLTSPSHTYNTSGTFSVSLTVRDITNGQIVFQGTSSVQITAKPATAQSSSAQSGAGSTGVVTATTSTTSWIGSLFKVGLIITLLLGLAVGMYMLFTWIKRKTAGHLSTTLENMEKTIVKTSDKTPEATAEPLKIKKESAPSTTSQAPRQEDVSEREKTKTEFSSTKGDNPTPTASTAPVPSWLAKASGTPASQVTTKVPEPAPIPAPAVPLKMEPAPVPDWLKPTSKQETKTETKPTEPVPKPTAPTPPVMQTQPKVAHAPTVEKKIEVKPQLPAQEQTKSPPPAAAQTTKPTAAPKPVTATETPKEVAKNATATSTTPSAPEKPKAATEPSKKDDAEPPIAFIKADSLTK